MGFRLEPTECANGCVGEEGGVEDGGPEGERHDRAGGLGCSAWGEAAAGGSADGSAHTHSLCPSRPRGSLFVYCSFRK